MSATTTEKPAARQAFDRTVADLKDGVASATDAYSSMSAKAAKAASDAAAFNQATLEAFAQSSRVMTAETQDLVRQAVQAGQTAMTESLSAVRAIMSAKSLREGMELQANFFRTAAIWSVTETARFARAGIDAAEKVSAPVTARAFLAAEKVGTYGA